MAATIAVGSTVHHPLMAALPRWRGVPENDYLYDIAGTGILYDYMPDFMPARPRYAPGIAIEPELPQCDEEYLEWIDVIEAVQRAQGTFTMIELGAGFGRWIARGAALARRRDLRVRLVGIEADPTHFRWMREHLGYNGVALADCELIQAAVTADGQKVKFYSGDADAWYGQAIAHRNDTVGTAGTSGRAKAEVIWVDGVSLQSVLARYERVDLIDLDVQGAEFDVLFAAADELNRRVRRVHIGTHGAGIEEDLRFLFTVHGWTCITDYGCGTTADTPYGRVAFGDGIQTWLNPRLQP